MRIVVIGAGITGLSIARVLTRYDNLEVVVVDKNPDVGWGVSKANTSIIHPCHEEDPDKHPLRTKLCLEGHDKWYEWTRELDIRVKWPGEIMAATSEEEIRVLEHYYELAIRNRVPGVRLLRGEELFRLEPTLNPEVIAGLYAPSAGTIDPIGACIALAENIVDNGGRLLLGRRVKGIRVGDYRVLGVETTGGFIQADLVVNAAGLYADEISRMAGISDYTIHPRRGQYLIYDRTVQPKPSRIIHSAPTQKTKGVYLVNTVGEVLLVGPTAEDLPSNMRDANYTTREGLEYVLKQAMKLIRKLPPRELVIRTYAGLRPEPSTGSFILRFHEDPWGFIEAAGIRSPGLTAAPGIAGYIEKLIREHVELKPREKWNPYRRDITRPKMLPATERNRLIRENPDYGRIICQCEGVSLGEVMEAVKRMKKIGVPEVTLDGLKFRAHIMVGRCQGTFCRPLTSFILQERLGLEIWSLKFNLEGSFYGVGRVKDLFKKPVEAGEK